MILELEYISVHIFERLRARISPLYRLIYCVADTEHYVRVESQQVFIARKTRAKRQGQCNSGCIKVWYTHSVVFICSISIANSSSRLFSTSRPFRLHFERAGQISSAWSATNHTTTTPTTVRKKFAYTTVSICRTHCWRISRTQLCTKGWRKIVPKEFFKKRHRRCRQNYTPTRTQTPDFWNTI